MDNLYRLRIFLHLAKTLNFSESARQLYLAQPAISRHIKELESEVGSPLFLRYKKRVQLSEAGKVFLTQITPVVSEYDRVFKDFKENRESICGDINIGSVPEAGKYLLFDYLIEFQKKYPDIVLRIELGSTDSILDKMVHGQLDFALVSRSNLSPALSVLPFFEDYPILVGSQESKNNSLDGEEIPIILYRNEDNYAFDFFEKNLNKLQRKNLVVKGVVNSHETMLNWTAETGAFSVVPFSSWNRYPFKNRLKIIKSSNKKLTLDLIYLKNSITELRKKIFLDAMKKLIR